jgi:transitional endoplasmic reticulum ATPase
MPEALRVKALEAYTRDVGRSIARLDPKSMEELNLSDGDIVEIHGASKTDAKCLPLYPSDWGQEMVRMDGLIRYNAGVSIGDNVTVRKASFTPAKKVVLTPVGEMSDIVNVFIDYWDQLQQPIESGFAAEVLSGVPVVSGDFVVIDYMRSRLFFLVLEKEPSEGVSMVSKKTKMELIPWITA